MRVKGEFSKHCDGSMHKGSRRVEAHQYWRKINDQWVWLCKDCWEAYSKFNGLDVKDLLR